VGCETQGEVKTTAEFGAGDWLALVRGRLYESFHSARHHRLHSSFNYSKKAKERQTETAMRLSICPVHRLSSCHRGVFSMIKRFLQADHIVRFTVPLGQHATDHDRTRKIVACGS
jgi:hypothetical protein